MRKIYTFSGIALIIFLAFACTIPSEVEITGSPSLKFAANLNFNNYLSDMFDGALNSDGNTKIITCTNPSLKYEVYILRMEIFRRENFKCEADLGSFTSPGNTGFVSINGVDIPAELHESDRKFLVISNNETIAETDNGAPYVLSFNGLNDYIEDFEFTGIKSKIYIYGTGIVNKLTIDLFRIKDDGTEELIVKGDDIDEDKKIPSGFESMEEYSGIELPFGGKEVDINNIINSGGDLVLKCKVYIPENTEIEFNLLDDLHTIVAEIVIWLPMTLESTVENAVFKFPDFFDGISDVFKSLSGTGCVETMEIKISIVPLNPFSSGLFVINDAGYGDIKNPLDDSSFFINLNKEQVEYINKNPFDPSFFVLFPEKNSLLKIQKGDNVITTISLNAKLKYNVEF